MALTIHHIDEIVSDPKIRGGRPVLKGTGFKVSDVVINYYHNGYSAEDIAEHFGLNIAQVLRGACLLSIEQGSNRRADQA